MSETRLWNVAVPAPLRRALTYEIPAVLGEVQVGQRVLVPLHGRRVTGYLLEPYTGLVPTAFSIKPALSLLEDTPALPSELLRFLAEASSYYMHPIGEVLRAALPSGSDFMEKGGVLRGPQVKLHRSEARVRPTAEARRGGWDLGRARSLRSLLETLVERGDVGVRQLRVADKQVRQKLTRLADLGFVELYEAAEAPNPYIGASVPRDEPPQLTGEQSSAVRALCERIDRGGYEGFLLHGVTGSGKTEVYLRAIERTIGYGRGALVLVPEIALTPQLVTRYRSRFGDALAVVHSAMTPRERGDQWRLLRCADVKVAIGVRSAVFAPVENLGIVIVDEEHDGSFKQERGFHYNARDLALLRAARAGAAAVLGSATPSLESFRNAHTGKLTLLRLEKRATAQALPEVVIVDLTKHRSGPGGQQLISQPLFSAMGQVLQRGEQIILFLNRRGYSPALLCRSCGKLPRCTACAVSLTYHRKPVGLVCHYCGQRREVPLHCPECGAQALEPVGAGTQKAESVLAELFPRARVARLDRDVASGRDIEGVLERLRSGEIDILVGTQMVTKGHDFPNVTLVGVLAADVGLHMPDFRAAERTFQLLTQVAGRAGRSGKAGAAMVQTYSPEHPAIVAASRHDYHAFVRSEARFREELRYPPFGRLAALRLSSADEAKVEDTAGRLCAQLRDVKTKLGLSDLDILGPAPAPIAMVQGQHRHRLLLRGPTHDILRRALEPVLPFIEGPSAGVRVSLDMDPVSML
ncbi:MAG: primosomal protein N' [Myxococcota bacterium]|jgi:primosomal protein N' (replication factor Y)|nr:primosomal protein N' [Myxococcota bacterium]